MQADFVHEGYLAYIILKKAVLFFLRGPDELSVRIVVIQTLWSRHMPTDYVAKQRMSSSNFTMQI